MDPGATRWENTRSRRRRHDGDGGAERYDTSMLQAEQETARAWLLETARLRPFVFYLCKKAKFFNSLNFFTLLTTVWLYAMAIVALMLLTDVIHLDSDNRGWMSLTASAVSVALLGLSAVSIVSYWEWYARISHRHLLAVAMPTIRTTILLFFAFLGVAIINTKYGGHAGSDDDDDLKFDDDDFWTDDKVRGKMAEQIVLGLLLLAPAIVASSVVDAIAAHIMPECKTSPIDFTSRLEAGQDMRAAATKPQKKKKKKKQRTAGAPRTYNA